MSTLEESTTTTENERRASWIASLRDVADFYEQHPDFPIDHGGLRFLAYVGTYNTDQPARFAELASMLGGQRAKDADDQWFRVIRKFGPFEIEVYAERDAVCTKVVVGSETVEVPDPAAPKITVEREVVEWTCEPSVLGASA